MNSYIFLCYNKLMEDLGIYVHIPFCESKCSYCNFVSFKVKEEEKKEYINNLCKEIGLYKNKEVNVDTIFIGGGTPTVCSSEDITKLFNSLNENFNINKNAEITLECNPNSFTEEKAKVYKSCGVNRLSFGLQSANNKLLKTINRVHNKKDFINAIKTAKNIGFKNINADILLGIPNQKLIDVKNTIKLLLKLNITHISCYSLILEENTLLFRQINEGKLKLPKEEKVIKMYDYVVKKLNKHNIKRYEVSNFAKLGYECKHNLKYWNLTNYLGLGLNAHSKINNVRYENFSVLKEYNNSLKGNEKPIKNTTNLTLEDIKEEFIMLGLRKQEGVNLSLYEEFFGERLEKIKAHEVNFLLKNNFIKIVNNNLFATNLGFKVLNQIILNLI